MDITLAEREYEFAQIIWEYEPISSNELVKLCEHTLGWKKSTTYTVLKKLCEKGIFQNKDSLITSCISKHLVQQQMSQSFMSRTFHNSLPSFINAFMNDKTLDAKEVNELKNLIEQYRKDDQ